MHSIYDVQMIMEGLKETLDTLELESMVKDMEPEFYEAIERQTSAVKNAIIFIAVMSRD